MSVHDLYSKRQKRMRGDVPDVYVYDEIPTDLRVQVIHILRDTIGTGQVYHSQLSKTGQVYHAIVEVLRKEYGVFKLPSTSHNRDGDYLAELSNFLLAEKDEERVIDAIELSFRFINTVVRDGTIYRKGERDAQNAIAELNTRFREHGIGYQFENEQIIRIDSQLIHEGVVKPAIKLLHEPIYAGVQDEFLSAHAHYRAGKYKEALVDCLKSLESALKTISDKRGWACDPKATCNNLIQIVFDNGLVPPFWSQHFNSLRSTLESGVPTARNRMAGHGQGSSVTDIPDYLVSYVLHQTASAIVFLAEAEKHLP
ncbi:MAG: hypothetical protein L0228_21765 [Planctomycetes bacterium]|nr:hypothetical protein [Planctomycetota bacterium]